MVKAGNLTLLVLVGTVALKTPNRLAVNIKNFINSWGVKNIKFIKSIFLCNTNNTDKIVHREKP